jgi:hypothetical protein
LKELRNNTVKKSAGLCKYRKQEVTHIDDRRIIHYDTGTDERAIYTANYIANGIAVT